MSEKHTPGPWRVRHRHYDAGPNEDEIGGLGWELEGPPEPMRGHFALAADAHLVAAAPDLLAALKELVTAITPTPDGPPTDWHRVIRAGANAGIAIRRAEGGAE